MSYACRVTSLIIMKTPGKGMEQTLWIELFCCWLCAASGDLRQGASGGDSLQRATPALTRLTAALAELACSCLHLSGWTNLQRADH